MLEDLKIAPEYDGFLFLAESIRNPPVLKPHRHAELELNLVANGRVVYVVDGHRFSFQAPTLLWLFPNQEHNLVDRSADARYYVAVFKPDLVRSACRGPDYRPVRRLRSADQRVLCVQLKPEAFHFLRQAMEKVLADGMDPDLLNREAGFGVSPNFRFRHNDPDWLNAGLRHLLLLAWRYQRGRDDHPRTSRLHPGVEKALRHLANPHGPEDLDELATASGVSPSHLSRLFKKQVGVPLNRYRNSVRLGRFWEELDRADNLLHAVLEAGFGSYAQFYRVFRESYGCGPREALRSGRAKRQRDH